jgi:hypothetical protein
MLSHLHVIYVPKAVGPSFFDGILLSTPRTKPSGHAMHVSTGSPTPRKLQVSITSKMEALQRLARHLGYPIINTCPACQVQFTLKGKGRRYPIYVVLLFRRRRGSDQIFGKRAVGSSRGPRRAPAVSSLEDWSNLHRLKRKRKEFLPGGNRERQRERQRG